MLRTEPRFSGSLKGLVASKFGPFNDAAAQRNFKSMQTFFSEPQLAGAIADAESHVVVQVEPFYDTKKAPDKASVAVLNTLTGDTFSPQEKTNEEKYMDFTESEKPGVRAFLFRAIRDADESGRRSKALQVQLRDLQKRLNLPEPVYLGSKPMSGAESLEFQQYVNDVLLDPEVVKAFQSAPSPCLTFSMRRYSRDEVVLTANQEDIADYIRPLPRYHEEQGESFRAKLKAAGLNGDSVKLNVGHIGILHFMLTHPEYRSRDDGDPQEKLQTAAAYHRQQVINFVTLWSEAVREKLALPAVAPETLQA